MLQEWSSADLVGYWTLVEGDWDLLGQKVGPTRLAFALTLKFFEIEARFPDSIEEFPAAAVEYVAGMVGVPAAELSKHRLTSSSAKGHRAQIRKALGFRPSTRADEAALTAWLASEVCPVELSEARQSEALLARCRSERIEPPGPTRRERIVGSARARADRAFCDRTYERLGEDGRARLLELIADGTDDGSSLLSVLKRDPGPVGLDSMLAEIAKLSAVREIGLPEGLFADASDRWMGAWRSRAVRMYPSDLRGTGPQARVALLAVLCACRQREITDALVDLLVALVHKINARAERRVEKQLFSEMKKVRGKEAILFRLAEAAVGSPDGPVRQVLFPVVGEETLRDLAAESRAGERVFREKVRTGLRSSYSSYYRQMLAPLLDALTFDCGNTAYRPVMDAVALLIKYARIDGKVRYYAAGETVPVQGVVPRAWLDAVADESGRVERIPYELCVLVALRDAIRRREIHVGGSTRWRDPEQDLPGDFEASRAVHYAAVRQPLDPADFIAGLKARMAAGLDRLSAALTDGSSGGVRIVTRRGDPWITVPRQDPLPEPTGLVALKEEVVARWGVLDLLDVVKNADFLTGFTGQFTSVAAYERIPPDVGG